MRRAWEGVRMEEKVKKEAKQRSSEGAGCLVGIAKDFKV